MKNPGNTLLFLEEGQSNVGESAENGLHGTNDGSFFLTTRDPLLCDKLRNIHGNGSVFSYLDGRAEWKTLSWQDARMLCLFDRDN